NRVARLLAAGHGGQTLLSHVAQELVRDQLPTDVELRDLGEHRLKDLIRPERIFQLIAPDLPSDFPPLKTLDFQPNNLPLQPNPFVGRAREVEAVRQRLMPPEVRLVTLTGVGGTGKTRLALQAAAELLDTFPDGVWFVNLTPIADPTLVVTAIATTLGVRETGGQSLLESVRAYLHDKQLLLLLDNFEQVLPAAGLVAGLLAASKGLKVLVTSRAPLHLQDERQLPVQPLTLPASEQLRATGGNLAATVSQYEAVRLFSERAQAVKPDFAITNANAPAVAEICARLDGLPLAIELAAARVKLLSPEALLQRLGSRLKVLTGGARDLPARQQTLRNTIEWSYELLDAGERQLFARLAVFLGGRTLEAIEAVCNAEGDLTVDVLDGVASLVDKSLLQQTEGPENQPRLVMLETIHEYAWERLEVSGEGQALRRRHAEYFLELAEMAEAALGGADRQRWLDWLEVEQPNFRAALTWSRTTPDGALVGMRLAAALWRFWETSAYYREGSQWLEEVLERSPDAPPALRLKAFSGAGTMAWHQGKYTHATEYHEQALSLAQELGDTPGMVFALNNLGVQAYEQGDLARSKLLLAESLRHARELGDVMLMTYALTNLGEVARAGKEYNRATAFYEEALANARKVESATVRAVALFNLAEVVRLQEDRGRAAQLYHEALRIAAAGGDKYAVAMCLRGCVSLAVRQENLTKVAVLIGAASALTESTGQALSPQERLAYEPDVVTVREKLGEEVFAAAVMEGQAMGLDQAVRCALSVTMDI
ncbi:MAG TPA: tetratricopeptide repeat protein, partial [Herpetosiphonaceae bacterium]|nr:tetratricopeptide repeat protein [Herpetosiphonaceae bacterium]